MKINAQKFTHLKLCPPSFYKFQILERFHLKKKIQIFKLKFFTLQRHLFQKQLKLPFVVLLLHFREPSTSLFEFFLHPCFFLSQSSVLQFLRTGNLSWTRRETSRFFISSFAILKTLSNILEKIYANCKKVKSSKYSASIQS